MSFYDQDDFRQAKKRAIVARSLLSVGIVLAFIAGLVPMLTSRQMALSVALSSAMAFVVIFLYGTLFAPALAYHRFMTQVAEGIRRTLVGAFVEYGGESVRDNVRFVSARFAVDEDEEPRLCYLDASIDRPALVEGQRYAITHTGNSIVEIARAEEDAQGG